MDIKKLESIMNEVRQIERPVSREKRKGFSVKKLEPGQLISVKGRLYRVEEKSHYQEGKWKWFEYKLFSFADGSFHFLEWEEDDVIEIALYDRTLSLRDLPLTKKDLEDFDDSEDGSFEFEEKKYFYEDSNEAIYFKEGKTDGTPFYYWDFEDDDEEIFLSVEKWGYEFEVSMGREILAHDIELIAEG